MLESFEYKDKTYTVHSDYGLVMLYPSIVVDETKLPPTLISMSHLCDDECPVTAGIRMINTTKPPGDYR